MYSRDRKTVLVVLVQLLCLAALGVVPAFGEEIGLTWDSNPEPEVAGYVVFVRTAIGTPLSFDAGDRTWYAFENAAPGTTYYFTIAAYTKNGVAGPRSNEISFHVPASVVPLPPVSNEFANGALANGSFESHFSGWTRAGSMNVVSGAYWVAADGYSAVAFNVGQQQPTGTLSQTLVTIPGQTYLLAFKAGAISSLNRHEQRLQVTVGDGGGTPLLSRTVSVFAPGNGTQYVAQAFTFVATGASATLTFRDVSAETMNVDLLLDDVRVTRAPR